MSHGRRDAVPHIGHGGRRRRGGGRRRPGAAGQHRHLRAELPRRRARDRDAAAERPQLHRPRAAAARRARLSVARRRLGRRARPRHERQRPGLPLQRLPARRHAAERLHQRAGRQRRRHRARHGDDPRVPRRVERLQRRVRPQLRRPDQRADQVGHQPRRTAALYEFHRNDALDAAQLLRHRAASPTSRATSSAAPSADRCAATACSTSSATRGCASGSARRSRASCPTTTRARGMLPDGPVAINAAVAPYLDAIPARQRAGASAAAWRPTPSASTQKLDQHFVQGRLDYNIGAQPPVLRALYARRRRAAPADRLPAVPARRSSRATSSSPASTATSSSDRTLQTVRLGYSRTRIGQNVEANLASPLPPFVAGRGLVGDIDIGGMQRFGPQSSANLRLAQNVFSGQYDLDAHARPPPAQGRRARRALPRLHDQPDVQPRASTRSRTCARSSRTAPLRFVGLTPEGDIDRDWRFTLFGFYAQDTFQLTPRLTRERRPALRVHDDAGRHRTAATRRSST